jgi:hypothetical protein
MILPVRSNCARIRRAARNVTRFYDACLAPVGITASRFTLLGYLKHQGPIRMGQLAEPFAMDIDRATLGHNLRPLERDGLLEIRPSIAELGWRQSPRPGSIASSKGARSGITRKRAFERAFGAAKAVEMRRMMDAAADVPLETNLMNIRE